MEGPRRGMIWLLAAAAVVSVIVVGAIVLVAPPAQPAESASAQASPSGQPIGSPSATPGAPSGTPGASASSPGDEPPAASTDYLLMPGSELAELPTSGPAWDYLVQTATGSWPDPNIHDQDSQADTLALAAALVYARTGDEALRARARDAIMAVIPTFAEGRLREGLGPLRQIAGWVLAADFAELEGDDEAAFRAFLERVLSERTGTHSRWNSVVAAHDDSSNNWGAWAGAARIAALLYLGEDPRDAVQTFRGFLGDRGAWSRFVRPADVALEWACNPSPGRFKPVNGACERSGIDLDGAIVADISRGSDGLQWPPAVNGIMYTHETLAGSILQAELLYRNGYPEIWSFESDALRRMADVISRSEADDGPGWNPGRVQQHIPWLLNLRYGTDYPTEPAEYGRAFGFTDWLYGS